ncbi:MAG: hypothetical protein RLY71_2174 [Pseudomonadota bacterium]|jgi:hypothetical protein
MRNTIVFVNTVTFSSANVPVGIDHLMICMGLLGALCQGAELLGADALGMGWLMLGVLVGHVRLWRHSLTLSVLGSLLLAVMSAGMSMAVSALVVNKLIAQQYRDAGWKIRNDDGQLGEYSSRFLAIHELGFSEDDLVALSADACMPRVVDWPDDNDPEIPEWHAIEDQRRVN